MKKVLFMVMMAMVLMTSCQQSKEDYIKEFEDFVEEVAEEASDYTEEEWEDVAKEFEAWVKQAEKYEDLTVEESMELAAIQAKYAGITAKKGVKKVLDGVKDLFKGDKE